MVTVSVIPEFAEILHVQITDVSALLQCTPHL